METNQEQTTPAPQGLNEFDKDRVIHSLVKKVQDLEKTVNELKNDTVIENLQLPTELLESTGVVTPPPHRLRRGRGWRPLLESEILEAQSKCENAAECARYLGVDYKTYRKHAMVLGLFKVNPWGKGSSKKYWAPDKGKYPLNQILEGKFPNYPVHRLKDLLIRSGTKKAECENCGFEERRVTDQKMPLILNFLDGNEKNHKLDNIQVLCYNCTFLCGKGYIRRGKVEFNFNDPDRIQGASRKIDARF
jgi:hypothetical protein